MSTATTGLKVVVDDSVQSRPELFEAVTTATNFFENHYRTSPPTEVPRESSITWSLGRVEGEGVLIPEVEERDDDGSSRSSRRFIPLTQTADPVNLEIWMLRLLRDILEGRSKKIMGRIDKLIRDMEDERNGSEVAH